MTGLWPLRLHARRRAVWPLAAKSLAYFDEAQGTFVVFETPVTLRIGSSSAHIRLEQKIAVVFAK
jgi:hypothetical protein